MTALTIAPAADVPWASVERLFDSTAASRHCSCRWWLTTNAEAAVLDDADRRTASQGDHAARTLRGLIARLGDEPIGWVGAGPRADFVRLSRTKAIAGAVPDSDFGDAGVWSIVCFIVVPDHRGTGVARALLAAAVAHAAAAGAAIVEAYPVDADAQAANPASTRSTLKPSGLNTGTAALFSDAGFVEVGARVTDARPVMRVSTAVQS
ncbi:MAG: GNAT family N-acetyltransferase [Microcella sp.]|uniref:GNAT family N-acetyltransferase n=1 Tax=Microcella sp. TaxID=1913979 RepID=UPI0024C9DA57|nr:GNAT family N-acetyltransferase [Microcella sp.]UYN84484.1 MAG: GNAT family N-acetyltransferase [Microcella sp.]